MLFLKACISLILFSCLPIVVCASDQEVKSQGEGAADTQVLHVQIPLPSPSQPSPAHPDLTVYPATPVAEKAVNRNLSLFTDRIRERFTLWLSRSGKYLDMMREILRSKNIPEDIAFLPLIESGFNPSAYSVARAVGPWQFIASTAKKYGLTIDWWRDERKDPVKSTEAAASYLSDLYGMFGSWNLAMAAYNAGEGKILRALNRTRSEDYWELLTTRHIKPETKEYVPRFIAAKMIAANPNEYGFIDVSYHPPLSYDEVMLENPLDLSVAARCAGTTVDVIQELNPELRRWSTPPNVSFYTLRIPAGAKESFLDNLSRIPEDERFPLKQYTIQKGDTIKKVSEKSGVPVRVILDLNDMRESDSLKAGKTLLLPPKGKICLDRDDRMDSKKKASRSKNVKQVNVKKQQPKSLVITSVQKSPSYLND